MESTNLTAQDLFSSVSLFIGNELYDTKYVTNSESEDDVSHEPGFHCKNCDHVHKVETCPEVCGQSTYVPDDEAIAKWLKQHGFKVTLEELRDENTKLCNDDLDLLHEKFKHLRYAFELFLEEDVLLEEAENITKQIPCQSTEFLYIQGHKPLDFSFKLKP